MIGRFVDGKPTFFEMQSVATGVEGKFLKMFVLSMPLGKQYDILCISNIFSMQPL